MLVFLIRRVFWGAAVVVMVAALSYGSYRGLRPELFRSEPWLSSTFDDVQRALLHFDFGRACGWPGCPSVHTMWDQGVEADLWMLLGGVVIGAGGGLAAGLWCLARPRTLRARVLESAGAFFFCAPVYVVGIVLIFAFHPVFGVWRPPGLFFDATGDVFASPWVDPWGWLQTLLVPWLVVAAPLGGAVLRGTLAMGREEAGADHVRTARAKGLAQRAVLRRHIAPFSYTSTAGLVWGFAPFMITNLVLVEWVFSVPGFFLNVKRALGKADPPVIDIAMLQAQAIWGAVLIVAMGLLADLVVLRLDPRVRARGL